MKQSMLNLWNKNVSSFDQLVMQNYLKVEKLYVRRHEDYDGSDIFWPGYVDATTNLILNLLFLLTILMVAVFMFALELGRSSKTTPVNPPVTSSVKQEAVVVSMASIEPLKENEIVSKSSTDPVKENIALKREIQRLKMLLAQQVSENDQYGGLVKTVEATSSAPKPLSGLDETLTSDLEVMVRFMDEAVALSSSERDQVIKSMRPIVKIGKTSIYVEVPAGFSEAKRMGFYRAMAVRNLLIEMKMPPENIEVLVVEGNKNTNASLVRVRSHW